MGLLQSSSRHDEYTGPNRRRHQVFVTNNSEYHCRDGLCLAVRDLHTGMFRRRHEAIGKKITSAVRFNEDGGIASISEPGQTHVGEQLCFASERVDHELITSVVRSIERPPKEIVSQYTH
jgi:hypothetical protein